MALNTAIATGTISLMIGYYADYSIFFAVGSLIYPDFAKTSSNVESFVLLGRYRGNIIRRLAFNINGIVIRRRQKHRTNTG